MRVCVETNMSQRGGERHRRHHGGGGRPRGYSNAAKNALAQVMLRPENQYCADCNMKGPTWASINLGLFMCMDCSGIHRAMGTHVTKVKSTTLDTWKEEWVQTMANMGNVKANAAWEANLPPERKLKPNATPQEREQFIRAKYQRQTWKGKPTQETAQKAATLIKEAAEEQREDDGSEQQQQQQAKGVNPAVARRLAKLRGDGGGSASPRSIGSADAGMEGAMTTPNSTPQCDIDEDGSTSSNNQYNSNSTAEFDEGNDDLLGLGGDAPPLQEQQTQTSVPQASSFSFLSANAEKSMGNMSLGNSNTNDNADWISSQVQHTTGDSGSTGFAFLKGQPPADTAATGNKTDAQRFTSSPIKNSKHPSSALFAGEDPSLFDFGGPETGKGESTSMQPSEQKSKPTLGSSTLSQMYATSDKHQIARKCADIFVEGMCPSLRTAENQSKSAVAPSKLRDEYTQVSSNIDEVAKLMKDELLQRYRNINSQQ
eukprot:gb/GECG01012741.1/.p1 GENE.gb/GECG01012741.1/~~gb/GECG01012741.1/.p1  ORF type:complete len:485 (+),score=77.88 gb/GECG01012741.1/:1-1455(+)